MGSRRPWLEALKESRNRRDEEQGTGDVIFTDAPGEEHAKRAKAPAPVTNIRPVRRDADDLRLIAAGWSPKDRRGPLDLTIWEDPETGFYCSREVALHRLDNPLPGGASPYSKLLPRRDS